MTGMNENALAILHYVDGYIDRFGFSPSYREIADELGLAVATVHYHVHVLAENDFLVVTKGYNRSLRVT